MCEHLLLSDSFNHILQRLKESDFISIFFLLMDIIHPDEYLKVVKQSKKFMEITLKKILTSFSSSDSRDMLIEILGTLKKYNLLKVVGVCRHEFNQKASPWKKLNKLWTFLYQICDMIDINKDSRSLKNLFPEKEFSCSTFPEILIAEAYVENLFSDQDLSFLSEAFKHDRPDISTMLDNFCDLNNPEYYEIKMPTRTSPCGLAVIINHENFEAINNKLKKRDESWVDVEALKRLWEDFGFKTVIHNDLKDDEVFLLFQDLAELDHSSYDIFVVCYLSHGDEGVVYASNGKPISISTLIDIMANKCTTLIDKPKLFFIQACQGTQIQRGVSFSTVQTPVHTPMYQAQSKTPLNCDVLKVVSSIPGYVSFSQIGKNSWFVESLVDNMKRYGNELLINDIMLKVTDQVSKRNGSLSFSGDSRNAIDHCKQTILTESTLRYKLQLRKLIS